jgi:hypothetical protein
MTTSSQHRPKPCSVEIGRTLGVQDAFSLLIPKTKNATSAYPCGVSVECALLDLNQ